MKELENQEQLIKYYNKHKKTIQSFFEIKCKFDNADELCKIAITGSTYRSFIRKKPRIAVGMSRIFKESANLYFERNPTNKSNQNKFLELLENNSKGQFNNWAPDEYGYPKLFKLYILYSNYWVAYQLQGSLKDKFDSISKLKVPLDKYSLTFIRKLYNKSHKNPEFKLGQNLSMGSVKSIEHYNSINKFIEKISSDITINNDQIFNPVYLDIIQSEENNLDWYSKNIDRCKKNYKA